MMEISRVERRWAIGFGLIVALITAIPYLIGFWQQGSDWRYTGYLFGVEDGNSYIAKMLIGEAGYWLFRTPYTPYPQQGVLAFLPYILLGKLTAAPGEHEQLVALFQLFRVLGAVLYAWASYDFIALFVRRVSLRRLGAALAMLGGGLGWLAIFGLSSLWHSSFLGAVLPGMDVPLEYYSPETFGFLMVFGLPHLATARALLLWGLRDYLTARPGETGRLRLARPGVLWLLMGVMQPLAVVTGYAILAGHLAFTWLVRRISHMKYQVEPNPLPVYFRQAFWMALISAPLVAYTFLAFRLDAFLRGWEGQNRIVSPPFHHYLLAYALVLLVAGWGIRPLFQGRLSVDLSRASAWLPLSWMILFLPLAYAPYNLQRRLPDGIWVAFLVVAMVGLECSLTGRARQLALRGLVGASFLSTLLLFIGSVLGVSQPAEPLYRPIDEVRGFEALAQKAPRDALVLASYETSNALPAWAPVKTLVGLGPESINVDELKERIACFYSTNCSDLQRVALLDEFRIDYVWYGPKEHEINGIGNWNPDQMSELTRVYNQNGYQIYQYKGVR